jgi:surface protein
MFETATSFNQNLNSWDVSSVVQMDSMFKGASSFNGNISSWDVSSVGNNINLSMISMFQDATVFNKDLSGWCVTNITSEPTNFSTSSALTNANKPVWGTCP